MDKVRAAIVQQGVRIGEFFQDFDRLRTGYVTESQFRQCLSMLRVDCHLTCDEIGSIVGEYIDPQRRNHVHYSRFLADSDPPPMKTLGSTGTTTTSTTPSTFSPSLLPLLRRVSFLVGLHGFDLKDQFADFDRHSRGSITTAQFRRALNLIFGSQLSRDDVDQLEKEYRQGAGRTGTGIGGDSVAVEVSSSLVRYVEFAADVESVRMEDLKRTRQLEQENRVELVRFQDSPSSQKVKPPTVAIVGPGSIGGRKTGVGKLSHFSDEELLSRFQKIVLSHRLRLSDLFNDYDPLRSGSVRMREFVSALQTISSRFVSTQGFQAADLRRIGRLFLGRGGGPEEKVRYKDFVSALNKTPQSASGSMSAVSGLGGHEHALAAPVDDSVVDLIPSELAAVLEHIHHQVTTRRIELDRPFLDFDRTQKGTRSMYVTPQQFCRVLDVVGVLKSLPHFQRRQTRSLSKEAVYQILCRHYADRVGSPDVNYVRFVEGVMGTETRRTRARGEIESPSSMTSGQKLLMASSKNRDQRRDFYTITTRVVGDHSVEDILAEIRLHCNSLGKRCLRDFLQDRDPLRSSFVTSSQFRSAIGMAQIHFSDEQFVCLLRRYGKTGTGQVNYHAFCEDLDREGPSPPSARDGAGGELYDAEMDELLSRLRLRIQVQRDHISSAFVDADRFNTGKISRQQFIQGLDRAFYRPPLKPSEISKLVSGFYRPEVDWVFYRKFLDALGESTKGFQGWRQDKTQQLKGERVASNRKAAPFPTDEGHVASALRKIRIQMETQRIHLRDLFHDFDPLRHGHVAGNKFHSVLVSSVRLAGITADEMKAMLRVFAHPRFPQDVQYEKFCDAIRALPSEAPLPAEPAAPEDPRLAGLIQKLRVRMSIRRILLRPAFADSDRLRKGVVTKTQFSSALAVSGFTLTADEFALLHSKYECPNGVNYDQFLIDLEM